MQEIERGSTYALYRGTECALRMDWNRENIRCTYAGHVNSSSGELIIRQLDMMARSSPSFTLLHDFWEVSSLDSQVRVSLGSWSRRHPRALASVHALSRSKAVTMGMSVLALADPGLKFHSYAKRPEFELLCGKLGLPLNFLMPTLTGN